MVTSLFLECLSFSYHAPTENKHIIVQNPLDPSFNVLLIVKMHYLSMTSEGFYYCQFIKRCVITLDGW